MSESALPDRFRSAYRELSTEEKERLALMKNRATDLETMILAGPVNRERSLALTKLEECVMWATKAMTG